MNAAHPPPAPPASPPAQPDAVPRAGASGTARSPGWSGRLNGLAAAGAEPGPPALWQVRLLGAVQARPHGLDRAPLERWPSRAVAALLARLALAPGREHPREELVELLWPGVALEPGRNRLRQALSTLKSLLEGPGASRVLEADRLSVRVRPGALTTDVHAFETALRSGRDADALACYGGEFMPGHYADWVVEERHRLCGLHATVQQRAAVGPLPATGSAPAVPAPAPWPAAVSPLPSYLTRLFGAGQPAARLQSLVLAQRLVCVVGPGGCGKTRLAVEAATALRGPAAARHGPAAASPAFAVVFVPLVACRSASEMLEAIARRLGLPGAQTAEDLLPALQGRPLLLLLDNFEQLPPAAANLLAALLAQAPQLHLLVTSRQRLGLDGEALCVAEPLPTPPVAATPEEAAASPAVALFVDRARALRAEFQLNTSNCAAVVGLVRLLQGLPLAIELAASRMRSYAPAELLALLEGSSAQGGQLALLQRQGGRGAADDRHASMQAVLAWSWDLLQPPARTLLQALALYPADAPLAGLAATAGQPLAEAAATVDELALHGLLQLQRLPPPAAADGVQGLRARLLEPVREFVLAQPAPWPLLRARLRAGLLRWAQALPSQQPAAVAPELPTIHAVLADAGTEEAPAAAVPGEASKAASDARLAALQLAVALRRYWDHDTLPLRLQQTLERALERALERPLEEAAAGSPAPASHGDAPAPIPALLRSDAHELLAYQRFGAGFTDQARAHAEAALACAGTDPARQARALVRGAWVAIAAGRAGDRAGPQHARARAALEQALALARGCDDREAQARALHQLGILAGQVHAQARGADPAAAEALFAQSQALWEALGESGNAHARLRNRAQCWRKLGRADEAMAAYRRCERVAQVEGDWIGQIDCLISMGELLAQQRRWDAVLQASRAALALCWQHWFRHGLAYALWNPPRALAHVRQPEAAQRLMAFATVFWRSQFGPLCAEDEREVLRVQRLVVRQVGARRAAALWDEGLALDVASAVRLLLPLPA